MRESANELNIEQATLQCLARLGYSLQSDIDSDAVEREDFSDVVLIHRMRSALGVINPSTNSEVIEKVIDSILRTESPSLLENNYQFHILLTQGVDIEYRKADGKIAIEKVWLVDFDRPDNNDWLIVNQFPMIDGNTHSSFNVIIFLNGLPLGLIELLKSIEQGDAVKKAFNLLQPQIQKLPNLFSYNEILVVSDGFKARLGSFTNDWKHFMSWKATEGEATTLQGSLELETLIKDVFEKQHFLDLIKHFIVFEVDNLNIHKRIARYYQFNAVNKAVASTIWASSPEGDRRAGIIWHIQGSGKSLTMAFYAGKIIQHPAMANPTILILTDRRDLEDQLIYTFTRLQSLLGQRSTMAHSRYDLQKLLTVASGGIVFSTVQMFHSYLGETLPVLSNRRNIIIIVEEIHHGHHSSSEYTHQIRSALPNASFIGFTSIPIEVTNRDIKEIFGDYVDMYDIQRAIDDNAIVPVYYEDRSAKLGIKLEESSHNSWDFERIIEEERLEQQVKYKSNLETIVGNQQRIASIANDLVQHFERRLVALEGKAIIICISRRVCLELYHAITQLRPQWHHQDDEQGVIKVAITGSSLDPESWQPHIRNAARRTIIARRFINPEDSMKIVIVRDMWLTSFDAPCVHTIYLDAPLRGQNLIQAISRVNRVFNDKPSGLIVDYLGLTSQIETALNEYLEKDNDQIDIPLDEVIAVMMEKYEIVSSMLNRFGYTEYDRKTPVERSSLIASILEHILNQGDGKTRFINAVRELSRVFVIAEPDSRALAIKDDVDYFQMLQAVLSKVTIQEEKDDLGTSSQEIISEINTSKMATGISAVLSLEDMNTPLLSNEFLEEVRQLPQKHLALEILRKLITDNIEAYFARNIVQSRKFTKTLEHTIRQYQSLIIESTQAISIMIDLAKEIDEAQNRSYKLGLTEEHLAFYDILLDTSNISVKFASHEMLKQITNELVEILHKNSVLDWAFKESTRAKLRVQFKHLLRRYGYQLDRQEEITNSIIEQAELLSDNR